MSSEPVSGRTYTDTEVTAIRAASRHLRWTGSAVRFTVGRGAAWWATGTYWPDKCRQEATRLEQVAARLREAATAMDREFARWPE